MTLLLLACWVRGGDTPGDDPIDSSGGSGSPDDSASLDCPEGPPGTWYADTDGDTYGDPAAPLVACEQPDGSVENSLDCDDTDGAVNPLAEEICGNGVDDDCTGGAEGCRLVDGSISSWSARSWKGSEERSRFGFTVAGGDLDRDGVSELLIGEMGPGGAFPGYAYLLNGPITSSDLGDATALSGAEPADRFGWRVAVGEDITGDGGLDVLISSRTPDGRGRVTVFLGDGMTEVGTLEGAEPNDEVGSSLGFVGDWSGDGLGDFVVGVGDESSEFRVYEGPKGVGEPLVISNGCYGHSKWGQELTVGDVDGDGAKDLFLGSTTPACVDPYASYGAALVLGPRTEDLDVKHAIWFYGMETDQICGEGLALGDLDGDGHAEIIVGCPNTDWQSRGQVWVVDPGLSELTSTDVSEVGFPLQGDGQDGLASSRFGHDLAVRGLCVLRGPDAV